MYVVAYYIVLAMRNESTMVNSKKILYYCFTLQCMIQLSIYLFHVLRLTCIDIDMYTIYF